MMTTYVLLARNGQGQVMHLHQACLGTVPCGAPDHLTFTTENTLRWGMRRLRSGHQLNAARNRYVRHRIETFDIYRAPAGADGEWVHVQQVSRAQAAEMPGFLAPEERKEIDAKVKPPRRRFTQELLHAQKQGQRIVVSLAPYEGAEVVYDPRFPGDACPWLIKGGKDTGMNRFRGRECHAVEQAAHSEAAAVHPLPVGTRVRHYGQQWPAARQGTATIIAVKGPYTDGTWEYQVRATVDFSRRPGPDNPETRTAWWSSNATRPASL